MSKFIEFDGVNIHRGLLLNGLRAMLMAHLGHSQIANNDAYSCGYQDGVENTIMSLAHMVGVSDELAKLIPMNQPVKIKNSPVNQLDNVSAG